MDIFETYSLLLVFIQTSSGMDWISCFISTYTPAISHMFGYPEPQPTRNAKSKVLATVHKFNRIQPCFAILDTRVRGENMAARGGVGVGMVEGEKAKK